MRVNGGVCERIATHMWELDGDIYGFQPVDHKYGQQATEALKQKRRTMTELLHTVYVLRHRERDLRGICEVWGDGLICNALNVNC